VQVLPKVCPSGKTSELLAAHGQKGGSKQKIGAVQGAEAIHPDKRGLHVSLQGTESAERPGRWDWAGWVGARACVAAGEQAGPAMVYQPVGC
jgi:hypothetical protein